MLSRRWSIGLGLSLAMHGLPAQKLLYNNNYKESGNGTESGAESHWCSQRESGIKWWEAECFGSAGTGYMRDSAGG